MDRAISLFTSSKVVGGLFEALHMLRYGGGNSRSKAVFPTT